MNAEFWNPNEESEEGETWVVKGKKKKLAVTLWVKWGLRTDPEFSNVGKICDHKIINFFAKVDMRAQLEKL